MSYRIKVYKLSVILFLELFLVLPYPYVISYAWVSTLISYLQIAVFIMEFFYLLFFRGRFSLKHKQLFTSTDVLIAAFVFFQCYVTISHHSRSVSSIIMFTLSYLLIILILSRELRSHFENAIFTVSLYFYIAIFLNTICVFLFPNGLNTSVSSSGNRQIIYLLSNDNQFGKYLFSGFALIWFTEETLSKKNHFFSITTLLMILATYFKTQSGSGLIASIILSAFYILYHFDPLKKIFSFKIFTIAIAVAASGLLLGARFLYSNRTVVRMIAKLTGKDMTFSGRLFIWRQGIFKFFENPIWGYGKAVGDAIVRYAGHRYSAHNIFLQILLESGLIGLCLFALIFISSGIVGDKIIEQYDSVRILNIGIFTSFVYFFMEVGTLIPLFIVSIVMIYFSYQKMAPIKS